MQNNFDSLVYLYASFRGNTSPSCNAGHNLSATISADRLSTTPKSKEVNLFPKHAAICKSICVASGNSRTLFVMNSTTLSVKLVCCISFICITNFPLLESKSIYFLFDNSWRNCVKKNGLPLVFSKQVAAKLLISS